VKSFVEKIQREGKEYQDPLTEITDLAGIRIISYYKEDVDKINKVIEKEFDIDRENSSDKAELLDPEKFGYLSVHYVISLSPDRKKLPVWEDFANIKGEIQVRTVLQHAWAAIDHKLMYKREKEVPTDLRRKLFRLSALLELADDQFSDLRRLTEEVKEYYAQQIKKGRLDIQLDLSSLIAYLETIKPHPKWEETAERVGFLPLATDLRIRYWDLFNRTLLSSLQLADIRTIAELDTLLQAASKWGRDVLAGICKISSKHGFKPLAVPQQVIAFLVFYGRRDILDANIVEQTRYVPQLRIAIKEVMKTG